ncbi:tRNA pseudouridine(55) synthase TruB [Patescibacteria group bacterium]
MDSENLILIDKPKGITSFDVIRRLRKKLNVRKMGHAGTLDPLASGLLIIGIEKGTKQLKDLIGLDKEYEAEVLLGIKTNMGDMEGEILEEESVDINSISTKLGETLNGLVGVLELPVPIYSAIKRGGEALYKKARRGEDVEAPIKKMEIKSIDLLDTKQVDNKVVLQIRLDVSSGTYIRSIAEEIGRRLGVPATIKELRRTKVGDFDVKNAEKI